MVTGPFGKDRRVISLASQRLRENPVLPVFQGLKKIEGVIPGPVGRWEGRCCRNGVEGLGFGGRLGQSLCGIFERLGQSHYRVFEAIGTIALRATAIETIALRSFWRLGQSRYSVFCRLGQSHYCLFAIGTIALRAMAIETMAIGVMEVPPPRSKEGCVSPDGHRPLGR